MKGEPIADPLSEVADVAPITSGTPPRRVLQAGRLLWISFVLGLPAFVHVVEGAQESSGGVVMLGVVLAILAVSAYMIVCIRWGRHWARVSFLVLLLVGVAADAFLPAADTNSPLEDVCGWISTLMESVAMVLVFTRPGSLWFHHAVPAGSAADQ